MESQTVPISGFHVISISPCMTTQKRSGQGIVGFLKPKMSYEI